MDATKRFQEAHLASPRDHLDRCFAQRVEGPARAGSYVPGVCAEELELALLLAGWEEYSHPAVQAPAVAFKAQIPGIMDLVALAELLPEHEVQLLDPKGTGSVEACVRLAGSAGTPVEFTVALLGPGDDGKDVVWTFFPGDPIRPSAIPAEGNVGRRVSAAIAIAMGLPIAKVIQ